MLILSVPFWGVCVWGGSRFLTDTRESQHTATHQLPSSRLGSRLLGLSVPFLIQSIDKATTLLLLSFKNLVPGLLTSRFRAAARSPACRNHWVFPWTSVAFSTGHCIEPQNRPSESTCVLSTLRRNHFPYTLPAPKPRNRSKPWKEPATFRYVAYDKDRSNTKWSRLHLSLPYLVGPSCHALGTLE